MKIKWRCLNGNKKIQIIDSLIKQAENADTLDGKHADEFATSSDVVNLQTLVGDESVSAQITNAVAQKSQVQIITWEVDD